MSAPLRSAAPPLRVAEAARVLGISQSRVRFLRHYGVLEATEVAGRHAVSADSVARLRVELRAERARKAATRRSKLRLVIDNG